MFINLPFLPLAIFLPNLFPLVPWSKDLGQCVCVWNRAACGFWLFLWCIVTCRNFSLDYDSREAAECDRSGVILAFAKKSTLQFKWSQEFPFAGPYATSIPAWRAPGLKIAEKRLSVCSYTVTLIIKYTQGGCKHCWKCRTCTVLNACLPLVQAGISAMVDHWAEYPGASVKA